MTRPLCIDLFCGAGGASMGLYRAGFDVVGIDSRPMPRYPFTFMQGDALNPPIDLRKADFIWASPPCQAYTNQGKGRGHPELIEPTRAMLRALGIPYAIENVVGAPLIDPVILCGSMFGLRVRRHRKFETSFDVGLVPPCQHNGQEIRAYYGSWGREAFRAKKPGNKDTLRGSVADAPRDMGIDWMDWKTLTQAIPPAYGEFIGRAALAHITSGRAAA